MRDINRLIIKAKNMSGSNKEKLEYVMLGYECPNHVTCMVWNGKPGQGRYIESDHETREDAIEAIKQVAKEYPNCKNVHGIDLDGNTMALINENEGILIDVDWGDE